MKPPSFRFMGGKARLRNWLISYFPKFGGSYLEPFAGRGNVFFGARKELNFNSWFLSDIDISFLLSLSKIDISNLPDTVSKSDFEQYKCSESLVAKVVEPRITFAGKGYKYGFDKGDISHPPYNGVLYRKTCSEAQYLLNGVQICCKSWDLWDYSLFGENDFIYFDPPYFGTNACYPNVDHEQLVEVLNTLKCKWCLSGYYSDLYDKNLKFANVYVKERNSEIKGSNSRKYEPVNEMLWTNFYHEVE